MPHLDTYPISAECVRVTQTRTNPDPGEVSLGADARAVLRQVGTALDADRRLQVRNGGLVDIGKPATPKENGNGERQGKTRSAARSRQRSSRREGPAGGSRPASTVARICGGVLRAAYEGQVTNLKGAYPSLRVFPDDKGMWLLAESSIISGLTRRATFLVALPFQAGAGTKAWGFWTSAAETKWIGPRHTNFGDGSICAFSQQDQAWFEGGDLRTLVDLYSVWALRHLHLEVFGRWPGKQYALGDDPRVQAYYRLRQCHDDERCGCGSVTKRYADCHKPLDFEWNFVELATLFGRMYPGGFATRRPPPPVVDFIEGRSALPSIATVHPQVAPR